MLFTFSLTFIPVLVTLLIYLKVIRKLHAQKIIFETFVWGLFYATLLSVTALIVQDIVSIQEYNKSLLFISILIEKLGAFLILNKILKQKESEISVQRFVLLGMVFGLGFSTLENFTYSITHGKSIILVRLFSAVPMHVTSCGVMGYFSGVALSVQSPIQRRFYFGLSFFIALFFHVTFDFLLYVGGFWTYMIGPLLVFLIFYSEYLMASSSIYPNSGELGEQKLNLNEWKTIDKQPRYERWILQSMGKPNQESIPFFLMKKSIVFWILIVVLVIFSFTLYNYKIGIIQKIELPLTQYEQLTLFVILPLTLALNLIMIGSINPYYLKDGMIQIPILSEIKFKLDDTEQQMIVFDIGLSDAFIKTMEPLENGTELEIHFEHSNLISPKIKSKVVWENHEDFEKTTGTVVQLYNMNYKFLVFILKYHVLRFFKGLFFNLKLPGFKYIRKEFVRDVSVMETEKFYPEGTILFKEGDLANCFFLIKQGIIEIYKTTKEGHNVTMSQMEAGQIFGEMALVAKQERVASARCLTDCTLAYAQSDNLEALLQNNPEFALKLIETLVLRLKKSESILTSKIDILEYESKIANQIEEELFLKENLFESIINDLDYKLIIICPDLKIEYANQKMLEQLKVENTIISQQKISDYTKDITSDLLESLKENIFVQIKIKFSFKKSPISAQIMRRNISGKLYYIIKFA